ncbi:ribosomal protein S18-alanine N-acetyltransferase [Streptococcus parauberis]|uniref:[Ribosomal protein bS18]-alanine N-acetyltransferase n=3 Tax=Streptococcus parauberis TaxID=1348 RepID=A0A0E2UQ94_9STRE|nr:ribosomal protein S18-alanine N-acetyltransferase [Streptococcus parauberis]AEF26097.1 acetyltransferase (GNAT) family protein [Streptococcus parauberis KCTC 11537]AUT05003.1 Ribosomal-protein-alanine N-acetyltransferase [Streptococcus parauberis]EGE54995.1 ribosomal-protein-alanine acetyltransferase [Streptococcus parauberis NCFD 2020]EMF48568.1 Ribosomal-protein-S18p-alanine acetyltransferase [Streptococcus parauberis KRS-02109]EMG25095.1 Ribosomal-protein-S18p-alanine acetyltransferase [
MQKAQSIYAILDDAYQGQSPWNLKQIEADLSSPNNDYFFAYDQEQLIGFLSVQQLVGELELTNIAVKSRYQGKGIGAQLMTHLFDYDLPIFLEVRASNSAAQALYKSCGFAALAIRKNYYHNPVEDAVVMKKEGRNDR